MVNRNCHGNKNSYMDNSPLYSNFASKLIFYNKQLVKAHSATMFQIKLRHSKSELMHYSAMITIFISISQQWLRTKRERGTEKALQFR